MKRFENVNVMYTSRLETSVNCMTAHVSYIVTPIPTPRTAVLDMEMDDADGLSLTTQRLLDVEVSHAMMYVLSRLYAVDDWVGDVDEPTNASHELVRREKYTS